MIFGKDRLFLPQRRKAKTLLLAWLSASLRSTTSPWRRDLSIGRDIGRRLRPCRGNCRSPFTLAVAHFWSTLILAAWFIEGDGNVDTLDYRDRLRRWCFG
jgi:hypothetical protein